MSHEHSIMVCPASPMHEFRWDRGASNQNASLIPPARLLGILHVNQPAQGLHLRQDTAVEGSSLCFRMKKRRESSVEEEVVPRQGRVAMRNELLPSKNLATRLEANLLHFWVASKFAFFSCNLLRISVLLTLPLNRSFSSEVAS